MRVSIEDGKYEYVFHEDGRSEVLRYGESWRDCVGDKFTYCMAAEIESLRQQLAEKDAELAAIEAREQQANECRIALVHQIHELADHIERAEYCINDIDMLKQMRGQRAYAMKVESQWNQNGNPFSVDTSALEALIAKAGKVMRERCANAAENPMWRTDDEIRALPGVTLEDLK